MTWFRVDDGWHSHPKVLALSLAACGLWAKAGSWSAFHLTDGHVPAAAVRSLGGSTRLASELVTAGLWDVAEDGYQFHEWEVRNPTREQVETKREKTRTKVTAWRDGKRNQVTNQVSNRPSNPAPIPGPIPGPAQAQEGEGIPKPLVVFDPRDDEHAEAEPNPPPWVQLLRTWERVAANGYPLGDATLHRGRLERLYAACEARDAHDPVRLFERVACAYVAAKRGKGKAPGLKWFCEDFDQWVEVAHAGSTGAAKSPLLRELEAARADAEAARKSGDPAWLARADRRLEAAGRACMDASNGRAANA